MSSLAQECNSPDSRGSSSQYIGSPMRSEPVCRICDEAVRQLQWLLFLQVKTLRAASTNTKYWDADTSSAPMPRI